MVFLTQAYKTYYFFSKLYSAYFFSKHLLRWKISVCIQFVFLKLINFVLKKLKFFCFFANSWRIIYLYYTTKFENVLTEIVNWSILMEFNNNTEVNFSVTSRSYVNPGDIKITWCGNLIVTPLYKWHNVQVLGYFYSYSNTLY